MNQQEQSELLICTLAARLAGLHHVAVGANSPIPAAAALLAQATSREPMRVSILTSPSDSFFTDGGKELFDCAAQGRVDAFFLSGAQIDGKGNINLVGTGPYPNSRKRFAGSFGSAYLYFMVPRILLFREEHSPRVLVEQVDFVSAPGVSTPGIYRKGGPDVLVTGKCVFEFQPDRERFRLQSVHPGYQLEDIQDATGFAFDAPENVPQTPLPGNELLARVRGPIAEALARSYPRFAAETWGA